MTHRKWRKKDMGKHYKYMHHNALRKNPINWIRHMLKGIDASVAYIDAEYGSFGLVVPDKKISRSLRYRLDDCNNVHIIYDEDALQYSYERYDSGECNKTVIDWLLSLNYISGEFRIKKGNAVNCYAVKINDGNVSIIKKETVSSINSTLINI